MTDPTESKYLAVSSSEMSLWGCPYCGYRNGSSPMSCQGSAIWVCGECRKGFIILAEGYTTSTIGLNAASGAAYYPTLSDHPRRGTPSHGAPDDRPENGEFFSLPGDWS